MQPDLFNLLRGGVPVQVHKKCYRSSVFFPPPLVSSLFSLSFFSITTFVPNSHVYAGNQSPLCCTGTLSWTDCIEPSDAQAQGALDSFDGVGCCNVFGCGCPADGSVDGGGYPDASGCVCDCWSIGASEYHFLQCNGVTHIGCQTCRYRNFYPQNGYYQGGSTGTE